MMGGNMPAMKSGLIYGIGLWVLFFLICWELGYPTLNRYDARRTGNADLTGYYQLVKGEPQSVPGDLVHRVLVPFIARPFYRLASGKVGTWDPVFFGMLIVNAFFTATTAFLLVSVGYDTVGDSVTALLSGMIYLLNFAVVNFHVAAFVESAQACFVMAMVWSLYRRAWWLLPVWGVLGALAKETSVPLLTAFAAGWWLAEGCEHGFRASKAGWIVVMAISGIVVLHVLMSVVSPYTLWTFAYSQGSSDHFHIAALVRCIFSRGFWYVFIWLLPLGVWRLRSLPRPWILGTVVAVLVTLVMGAYSEAGDNAARPLFNVAGALLSLSVAVLVTTGNWRLVRPARQAS